jgi:hypothetical protein
MTAIDKFRYFGKMIGNKSGSVVAIRGTAAFRKTGSVAICFHTVGNAAKID